MENHLYFYITNEQIISCKIKSKSDNFYIEIQNIKILILETGTLVFENMS